MRFRRLRAGDRVISAGKLLGGTSGRVVRVRGWPQLGFALVEVDGGWLKGKRLWLTRGSLVRVRPEWGP
ncbi:MAG: hypothetical protein ACT452_05560 [Microthrixaceae bacterium]